MTTSSKSFAFVFFLYKGLLIRKRIWFVDIILSILLASIPALLQSFGAFDIDNMPNLPKIPDSVTFDPLKSGESYCRNCIFAYVPSNNFTDTLIEDSLELWRRNHEGNASKKAVKNSDEMEKYCEKQLYLDKQATVIGTVFNHMSSTEDSSPTDLDYSIRYCTINQPRFHNKMRYQYSTVLQKIVARLEGSGYTSNYSASYFLSWQAAVQRTFIQTHMTERNETFDYELWMQDFAPLDSSGKLKNVFKYATGLVLPEFLLWASLLFLSCACSVVIGEKSNGSKELMKMMGMTDAIYWISTFMDAFLFGAAMILIVTVIYTQPGPAVFKNSDFLLLFIIFSLFFISTILYCFAVTVFFNNADFGTNFLLLATIISDTIFQVKLFFPDLIESGYYPLSAASKFAICLLPPGALLTIIKMLLDFEELGEGLQWSNINRVDIIPQFSMVWIILALLASCVLYSIVIWYVGAVWPWQYGVPRPLYFPFTKVYWCGYQESKDKEDSSKSGKEEKSDFFEDHPSDAPPGVATNNLSKVFRTGLETKVAVKNVSFNIYEGEITAILGPNGAGKTTFIGVLTGLYPPTSGTATINGFDISTQTSNARQSLGVCLQHNALYDYLTVEDHLKFYAALKGTKWSQLNQEVESVLNTIDLAVKRDEYASDLSGGMKRKLSLGIAIIGGSKVLFLDEPTTGLDMQAQRRIWSSLLNIRRDRTIVLTTHSMEEADTLGDRIAIMADGEIQCCGSSIFLKDKFGSGYKLHLAKEDNFNLNAAKNVLKKYVPDSTLEYEYEREVTFKLVSDTCSNFGPLFEDLDKQKEELGISSCGISATTLDDVFVAVASQEKLKTKPSSEDSSETERQDIAMKDIYLGSNEFRKSPTFLNHFRALFLKRLHYTKRDFTGLALQIILPFLYMCLILSIFRTIDSLETEVEPALKLDVKTVYGETDGFYSLSKGSITELMAEDLRKIYQENSINAELVSDPEQYIANYSKTDKIGYYRRFLMGGTVDSFDDKVNLTVWFNAYPYHAEPLSLMIMDTAILRRAGISGTIKLTNEPLPVEEKLLLKEEKNEKYFGLVFAMAVLSASFIPLPTRERMSKSKLLQMMNGVLPVVYWFAMFVWDFMLHITVSLLLIIPFAIFIPHVFFSPHSEAIGTTILLMILYGFASIPLSYLISMVFKNPTNGVTFFLIISVVIEVLIPIFEEWKQSSYTAKKIHECLRILPPYALGTGIVKLFRISFSNAICESVTPRQLEFACNESNYENPLFKCCKDICGDSCLQKTYPLTMEEDGVGEELLFLVCGGVLLSLLLLLLETTFVKMWLSYRCCRLCCKSGKVAVEGYIPEDSDVFQEKERVKNDFDQVLQNDALVAVDLTKEYKRITAVDHLTFGVHKRECFGLLGTNGAGKTTLFRMLTGDCYATRGNAYIDRYTIRSNSRKFHSYLGYCPQFDAFPDKLSGREVVTLFARLRGLSGEEMTNYVNLLLNMTDLTQYADKPSIVYSGGTKRKLSVALALIGVPPILLLDEPSAGIDPISRRKIWKILSLAKIHSPTSVILTTQSLEECEALSSRLTIMMWGRFRCMGSPQYLKSKFQLGYSLTVKMSAGESEISESVNAAKEHINANLAGALLKSDHQGTLSYHVADPPVTLSHLFNFMDEMKGNYNIEDYIVSNRSLEQVFLALVQPQAGVT